MEERIDIDNEKFVEPDQVDSFNLIDELIADNNIKDNEINEWKTKYTYLLADFDNYKKNAVKSKEDTVKYCIEKVIKDILLITDDFERAIDNIEDETVKKGVSLIYNKFINILKNNNVSFIKPIEDDLFDDTIHEAVSTINIENKVKNTIADCIQTGAKLNDKVIRYAKVIVYC